MGPHVLTNEKIPITQGVWQAFEIGMNAVILFTMLTAGFNGVAWYGALVLALWQAFEVLMNTWILITMFKVGFKTRTKRGEVKHVPEQGTIERCICIGEPQPGQQHPDWCVCC